MTTSVYHITIAKKIREYRKENKLSQRAFGRRIGVSAQVVCKWEQSLCYPDIFFLPILARILQCTIDDFFDAEKETNEYK
ncbi:MAG: helix-turn-helix transcriptional regulator [Clostridia bacterium]|nr:helix-turn-helix transcriptional regulator [Clostridia bacterium]